MKKRVFGKKLSRESHTRQALFTALIKSLVANGKIVTTKAKAKAILRDAEKLVTLAKNNDSVSIRRSFTGLVGDNETLRTLFDKIGPAFKSRMGGYVRLTNLPRRKGDAAEMMRMEWTEKVELGSKKLDVGKKSNVTKEKTEGEILGPGKKGLRSRVANLVRRKK